MKIDFNKIFQILVLVALFYVILILNSMYCAKPLSAQTGGSNVVPDTAAFPIKIANIDQLSSKDVAAFPVNKENQFVIVDTQNRSIMFYEIIWNGPTASIQVKTHTSF
ncbi:MAG: hypothetical protein QMC67_17200 [Candidatus Wallbacteria bacterium]